MPAKGTQPQFGAFDNMDDRPIRTDDWQYFDIVGDVAENAKSMVVGLLVIGQCKAWIDDASLEVVAKDLPTTGLSSMNQTAPAEPFWNGWLVLAAVTLGFMASSHLNAGPLCKFAFRFSCAYWVLYYFPSPISELIPYYGYRFEQWFAAGPQDVVVRWIAANILGIKHELVSPIMNGSGDTTFAYVQLLTTFVLAMAVALVWTVIDRRKTDYLWTKDLLRSYLRYVLAVTLLGYGLAKLGAIGNQFPAPGAWRLESTYGGSSPMGLAWTFMGASRAYTFFAGAGEVAGALLLIWRRTTLVGAMVAASVMLNVMMINFCYDVPVKLLSTHLLATAFFVMLPDAQRLCHLFWWHRAAPGGSLRPPYVMRPRSPKDVVNHQRPSPAVSSRQLTNGALDADVVARKGLICLQRAIKGYILVAGFALPIYSFAAREWSAAQSGLTRFLGDWTVDRFEDTRQVAHPALTSPETGTSPTVTTDSPNAWSSLSVWSFGGNDSAGVTVTLIVRQTNDETVRQAYRYDSTSKKLWIDGTNSKLPTVMDLTCEGHRLTLTSERFQVELHAAGDDYLLTNRGYHWINERPFNR